MLMPSLVQEEIRTAQWLNEEDASLLIALRRGEERAFALLIDRYHASMIRLALAYVPDRAVAEEVVQETWLGVLQGLNRFEGRSSLKTWIYRILINTAKTRGVREGRSIPFSALEHPDEDDAAPAVEAERFRSNGHWAAPPESWQDLDEHLFSQTTRAFIDEVINGLPPTQRQVINLRDIQGWSADDVCELLGVSETNQRVLLHRARSKVRRALEQYFSD